MLPAHLRLRRSQDFERVRAEGKSWRDHNLKLNVAVNGLAHSRYGFVVSRRVGNAVKRNHVKRQLRAVISGYLPQLKNGYDVVIITYPSVVEMSYHDLEASLGKLFELACLVISETTR